MIIKKLTKLITICFFSILLSVSNFDYSIANDHTPKRQLINKLKKEISDLGEKPVKKKNIFTKDEKWIEALEAQLEKLKKIEALKAELKKELEDLGEKPESDDAKELEADEEIIALRKQIEEVKAKKKAEEDKKKRDAKIAVAVEMLKDELAALGEEPIIDTSDIDSDEQIKALKKQIEEIKEKRKIEKAEAEKKAEEERKAEEK